MNATLQTHARVAPAGWLGTIFRAGWPRFIALFGFFLPAVVGVCVRAYLQHIGKPVLEWSWLLQPVQAVQFLVLLVYWDVPFLLVAGLAGNKQMTDWKNRLMILGAFLGTAVTSILLFTDLWRNIEAILMGALLIPFFILPGTFLGLAFGWAVGRLVFCKRTEHTAD